MYDERPYDLEYPILALMVCYGGLLSGLVLHLAGLI